MPDHEIIQQLQPFYKVHTWAPHTFYKQTQCMPINRNTKNRAKMALEMDVMDNMYYNAAPPPITKMTTCSLAQLAEKLK